MVKRIFYTLATVLWMIVIFMMSSQTAEISGGHSSGIAQKIICFFIKNPSSDVVDLLEMIIRKFCHFFEYAVLYFFCYKTLTSYGLKGRNMIYAVLIPIIFAVSDEIHQYFVPGRACRLFDVMIDASGVMFSYLMVRFCLRKN